MIEFTCPSCEARFQVQDEYAGKKGRCTRCKTSFNIPMPTELAQLQASMKSDEIAAALGIKSDNSQVTPRRQPKDITQPSLDAILSVHCTRCKTAFREEMPKLCTTIECPHCNSAMSLPTPEHFYDFHTKIRGVTQRDSRGIDRQSVIRTCRKHDTLFLSREPDNAYDSNAVAVLTRRGERIGYLSADLAKTFSPILRDGKPSITTIADITGDEILGVNIYVMVIGCSL